MTDMNHDTPHLPQIPQQRLAMLLGLSDEGQDWGIEQADETRLEEFIDFANSHVAVNHYEHELLAELIFQSAEDKLSSNRPLSAAEEHKLLAYVRTHRSKFPVSWEYWYELEPADWHIPQYLRRAIDDPSG